MIQTLLFLEYTLEREWGTLNQWLAAAAAITALAHRAQLLAAWRKLLPQWLQVDKICRVDDTSPYRYIRYVAAPSCRGGENINDIDFLRWENEEITTTGYQKQKGKEIYTTFRFLAPCFDLIQSRAVRMASSFILHQSYGTGHSRM